MFHHLTQVFSISSLPTNILHFAADHGPQHVQRDTVRFSGALSFYRYPLSFSKWIGIETAIMIMVIIVIIDIVIVFLMLFFW